MSNNRFQTLDLISSQCRQTEERLAMKHVSQLVLHFRIDQNSEAVWILLSEETQLVCW